MERLLLVLEGHAAITVGDRDLGRPGLARVRLRRPAAARRPRGARARRRDRRRPRRPWSASRRPPAARSGARRSSPRRTSWSRPAARATPPAASTTCCRRRAEAGRLIAFEVFTPGRQLVQLPAAQARHGEPAGRGAARGALLLQVREAGPGVRLRPRLHGGPLAGRGDDADGRRPRPRARGLPPGRRPGGLRLLLPQHHGRAQPGLALHAGPGPRVAHELEPRRAEGRRRDRAARDRARDPRPTALRLQHRSSIICRHPRRSSRPTPTEDP